MMTNDEIKRLASPEFNRVLADDPELRQLKSELYDDAAELTLLLEVLGLGEQRIGNLPVRPLTAAKWAFLWAVKNTFARTGSPSPADLEVFLLILSTPSLADLDCAADDLPGKAAGLIAATGLPPETLCEELTSVIRCAFAPLAMLPPSGVGEDVEMRYDADWLTRICSVATRESGETMRFCAHEMSLGTVCSHYVNFRRRESPDADRICRRPDSELMERIFERTDSLAAAFLSASPKDKR